MFKNKIISKAKELGFDLIGFSDYQHLNEETSKLKEWLNKGYQAGMSYMERNVEKREDVSLILDEAKSVISLGMNYYIDEDFESKEGKVSRYAWGKDYHLIIWEKLDILVDYIKTLDNTFEAKSYVDTGPVMDRAWAVKSGLGWQGKNSNVISKEIGSWFFISTIITNYEFTEYNIPHNDFCGTCTACIDSCPTSAIVEDYVVDSNKCISYLTIENKNKIPDKFIGKFENWIFGCDICQDVCPWNIKFAKQTDCKEFEVIHKNLSVSEVLELNKESFKKKFKNSPIERTKLKGIQRNAEFLMKRN